MLHWHGLVPRMMFLLHYLGEVTVQLDLKSSKSKPQSVIHVCCKVQDQQKSFSIHRKQTA